MTAEREKSDGVREFRLEGTSLLLVSGLLIVLLGGAFYGGRWYERQVHPAGIAGAGDLVGDGLASVAQVESPADVDQEADFFDDLGGAQKQAEPDREVPAAGTKDDAPGTAVDPETVPAEEAAPPLETGSGGEFYVQVVSGRDKKAIERLANELTEKGFNVRLFSEREGRGTLFKVRVGGYLTREDARTAAATLKRDGYPGAWVTTAD